MDYQRTIIRQRQIDTDKTFDQEDILDMLSQERTKRDPFESSSEEDDYGEIMMEDEYEN